MFGCPIFRTVFWERSDREQLFFSSSRQLLDQVACLCLGDVISETKVCGWYGLKIVKRARDVGIFGCADLAKFRLGFSVFALKNCEFSVLVFSAAYGFSSCNLVLVFVFCQRGWRFFGSFCPMHFTVFLFPKDVAPRSHSKIVTSSDHSQLERCMTSLVSHVSSKCFSPNKISIVWLATPMFCSMLRMFVT